MKIETFYDVPVEILSSEYGLYKPNLEQSNTSVLPSIARHMNLNNKEALDNKVFNPKLNKRIAEQFSAGVENLVFFICDAIGVVHLEQFGGFLWDNITNQGMVGSTMFPSMTSTVMTSISYGMNPSDHGLVGYNIYNEKLDTIWNSLNLKYLKDDKATFVLDEYQISDFVSGDPLIDIITAPENQITGTFLAPNMPYNPNLIDLINPNLQSIQYTDYADAGKQLLSQLDQDGRQLIAIYLGDADIAGHGYGPDSAYYKGAVQGIERLVSTVTQHPKFKDGSTIGALTADHGQVQVNHEVSQWMDWETWRSIRNEGVTLSTSGRVLHAYCEPRALDKGRMKLEELANSRGYVIDKKDAISMSGGNDTFEMRYGDFMMIMEDGYLADIPEIVPLGDPMHLHGQHGSLTPKELFVPIGLFGGEL
ncbi:MAG: alkaline phosphatase family protein [Candidatus Heimdallarchaeota archaeon]|nr:alkaline phosphatase family protein [Candidatus Heimdallarchaeota archaeon]MDH5646110.1 alkaline phosphatase family protein [Candidatus Heimdallarchaeota archaeon]